MTEDERKAEYLAGYARLGLTPKQISAAETVREESDLKLRLRYGTDYLVKHHERLLRDMMVVAFELPGIPK
jgi:hypothetical protein